MQYFNFLKDKDVIGVCAPSMGCDENHKIRCDSAVKKLEKLGKKVVFTDNCFGMVKARSADAKTRAKEFEQLFFDNNVSGIISMAGGEFQLETLPYINFDKIKKAKNKFFQGFSDNTCYTFLLTTMCDKASLYAANICQFGMNKWHKSLKDNYDFLCGKQVKQTSFKKHEIDYERLPGQELNGYNLKQKTYPKIISNHSEVNVTGRIIGGNLDVLSNICGTKFDKVKEFNKKYKDDGIIWYLESCDMSIFQQSRSIWQLKNAGWFENAKAILIGRPAIKEQMFDCDYIECNLQNLQDLNVPVVIDLDVGHVKPSWYIVNGAIANFKCKNNKAEISFELK